MKRFLVLAFAAACWAGPLSDAERDKAIRHLAETRARFLESVRGLSAEQWNFKPAPDVWSVGEVAEHITVSEGSILDLVQQKILKAPADPAAAEEAKGKDDQVLRVIPDRAERFQAPAFLQPQARWSQADLPKEFSSRRERTMEFIRSTQDDLRGHVLPHPVMKTLDAYQWILLLSAHSQRHTAQIEEVKAHPKFPKR
jgi:uncharacterized damage-inducible protein DinB